MSPQPQLHGRMDNQSTTNTNNNNNGKAFCPPPLKISKDSHIIRKSSSYNASSPSSSSSSTSSLLNAAGSAKPPQRHPVIIYTHSPKIIHTHPRDFMALVQKLTGMSRSDEEASAKETKLSGDENSKRSKAVLSDDNESSSVVTDENCCSGGLVEGQVNSCFVPPIFEPAPPPPQLANSYLKNIPVYRPNSTDFLCSNQPFFNYDDSLFFGNPNIHALSSTTSTLNDFCQYSEY